ncbi:chaplin family protein [Streptomyces sp. NPDC005648]|uniref:chaplin family protein n=1 Tax=Streptomyces sp. NPDC005648 TaxID=3157044 RepID=UPI0033B51369
MRQTLSRGMVAAAAATSILSLYGGAPALADTHAGGAAKDSPGVLSGNNIEAPVEVPVNACGNSVDVVAGLNPAFGNSCAHTSGSGKHRAHERSYEEAGYGTDDDTDDTGYGDTGYGSPGGYGDHGGDTGYGDHGGGGGGGGYGEHTPPGGEHTPPGGEHTPPGGEHTPPGGEHTPPGGEHTPPGGEHTPPGGETTPPGGETTPPGGQTTPPGGETTPPGGHTTPPGGQTTPPGGETTPPGGHTTPPGGGETTPPELPHTGGDGEALLAAAGASAVMIGAGAVLYRRGRAASRR